jgi:hypothetical protein
MRIMNGILALALCWQEHKQAAHLLIDEEIY